MVKKKYQLFISSTYSDLIAERQELVLAVLDGGHIPAGMELFTAEDKSQQEVIKRWIQESDAFILLVGGRYGSMLPSQDQSYVHWEYEYAGQVNKPRIVLLLSESAIQKKVVELGYQKATEQANPAKYKDFVTEILNGRLISIVSEIKDIRISVLKSLKQLEQENTLTGWISMKDVSMSLLKEKPDREQIKGKEYNKEIVDVDNKNFENCKFKSCIMTFRGIGKFQLVGCFFDHCTWNLEYPAPNVIRFLSVMYNHMGEQERANVRRILDAIENDNV